MLEIKNLNVSFKKGNKKIRVINDLSLNIPENNIVGLVGESGSGKSTIAKAIMGVINHSGKIIFRGEKIENRDLNFYKNIQMIFQNSYGSLNPRLSIKKILEEPILNFKIVSRKAIPNFIKNLMKEVGLKEDIVQRTPEELSGGQLQRIAIARAISVNPKILIADEPMSGLDMSIKAQIVNLFMKLHGEKNFSILLISHDLNLIGFLSDYIYVIFKGEIVERGKREEILLNKKHPYTRLLFESSPSTWKGKESIGKVDINIKRKTTSNCPFATICENFSKKCERENIEERKISSTHFVRCIKTI